MKLPKYLRNHLRKDLHAPTFLSSSVYRSVSARIYHGRLGLQSPPFEVLATDPEADEGVDLGGVVRNPRLVVRSRTPLYRSTGDNPGELGSLWGYSVLDTRRERQTISAGSGGDADQSGVPGAGPADGVVLRPEWVVRSRAPRGIGIPKGQCGEYFVNSLGPFSMDSMSMCSLSFGHSGPHARYSTSFGQLVARGW